MIVFDGVSKSFGETDVLDDVSLRITPGELVCITGPSGAGKSTLLHLLTAGMEPTEGTVTVDEADLHTMPPPLLQLYRRRIGFVFQDYKLLQHRTVAENIGFPLEVLGVPDDVIDARVQDVLKQVELPDQANAYPRQLSAGEQSRTAIGRAIVHKPLILIADEPTGNVDPRESVAIMYLFEDVHERGSTVIISTHDSGLVDVLQPRVITLEDGEITRDSTGGYDTESEEVDSSVSSSQTGKHNVFSKERRSFGESEDKEDEDENEDEEDEDTNEKGKDTNGKSKKEKKKGGNGDSGSGKRKVKVTGVN